MSTIIEDDIKYIINEKINWDFFKNKTILITGAGSFIISYFLKTIDYLNIFLNLNIKIVGVVRNLDKFLEKNTRYINNKMFILIEQDASFPIIYNDKIDIIIHAASLASPKYYKNNPVATLSPNVLGTYNLLNTFHNQIEDFIFISSSEIYGEVQDNEIPTNENIIGKVDPFNIRSCYAESKRMGENICLSWYNQFDTPIKVIRPFHTFGPGIDLEDGRVHCDFVKSIINNKNIVLKSKGLATRAFCYLSDFTIGLFYVLTKGINGEAYNIGNNTNEIKISELAILLTELFKEKNLSVVFDLESQDNYLHSKVLRNVPDISKLSSLGWKPRIDIREGFYRTIKSF